MREGPERSALTLPPKYASVQFMNGKVKKHGDGNKKGILILTPHSEQKRVRPVNSSLSEVQHGEKDL